MIAKHIPKDPKIADSFAALAHYIAGAREEGEKLDCFWMVNCNAGDGLDDLNLAIKEVEATQAGNRRAGPSKTYHLMVSFAAEEKPDAAALKDMEREFAKALGFEDHQRVCGAHANTGHYHFHVAYNRIHPETLRALTPWNDYRKLETCARAMEKKYGLSVALGMSDYEAKVGRQGDAGRRYEAQTWEQSFQSYVLEHRDTLVKAANTARDWQGFHRALGDIGLGIKPRGNGCVIYNAALDAKGETMKPSLVDRSLSFAALKKRLGPYLAPDQEQAAKPVKRCYKPRPLTRHPGQSALWRRYMQLRKSGKRRPGIVGRAIRGWKDYLYAGVIDDPMAMLIIISQRELTGALFSPVLSEPAKYKPPVARLEATLRPALSAWLASRRIAKDPELSGAAGRQLHEAVTKAGADCKQDDAGNLMVPIRDGQGHVRSLRLITPEGTVRDVGERPGLTVAPPEKTPTRRRRSVDLAR